MKTAKRPQTLPLTFGGVITAVSDKTRWRILDALFDEPLPAGEVARRLAIAPNNASKHLAQLYRAGVVTRGYGKVYHIPPQHRVAGEKTLDLGVVVLRLDHPDRQ